LARPFAGRRIPRDGDLFIYDLEVTRADDRMCERWEGLRLKVVEAAEPHGTLGGENTGSRLPASTRRSPGFDAGGGIRVPPLPAMALGCLTTERHGRLVRLHAD
jgi:hypothetical protein